MKSRKHYLVGAFDLEVEETVMTGYRIIRVRGATQNTDGLEALLGVVVPAHPSGAPPVSDNGGEGDEPKDVAEPEAWGTTVDLPPRWLFAAPWRSAVEQRRVSLAYDLARLDNLTPARLRERAALRALLTDAQRATQEKVRLAKWWWGTEVERAWTRLHEVEERTVDLLPVDELEARATTTAYHGTQNLKSDDKQLITFEYLRADVAAGKRESEALRPAMVEMKRRVHAQTDRDNNEARYLRNRILLASSMCVLITVGILLLQKGLTSLPFLDSKGILVGRPTTYIFLVMAFAAVGALITAIPSLVQIPSDFSPFNLPLQQAVLKIMFGPLVAVVGFAIVATIEKTPILNSDVVEVSVPSTLPGVLVLAVVFGAAQHLVTRFVDRRAEEVLGAFAPDSKTTA